MSCVRRCPELKKHDCHSFRTAGEALRESLWGHSRQREEQALREVDSGDVTEMSNQGEV